MSRSLLLVCALWASTAACDDKQEVARGSPPPKSSNELPAAIPAGYPLPATGRSLHHSTVIDERQIFEFRYEGGDVAKLADALRTGLVDGGWSITYSDKQGERHFLSTERDGKLIDATVFPTPEPTITVTVQPAAGTAAKPGTPPDPNDRGRLLDDFPKPDGGTHDPGYASASPEYPERLYHVPARTPVDVAAWFTDAAKKADYLCSLTNPPDGHTCSRKGQKEWISARIVAHPLGGTAYFIGVLPGE